ncbi:MAG: DUF6265 family protein [Myxococcota bacterium]
MLPLLLAVASAQAAPTLDDLTWLVGTWRGGTAAVVYEETWQRPLGGAMMGAFRYADGDTVHMYEIMTLTERELRIKHFGGDLLSWERKKEVTRFAVTEADASHIVFAAVREPTRLVYTRTGDTLEVRLEKKGRDAETFRFERAE